MKLRIATCQFAVTGEIKKNAACIAKQMHTAWRRRARVVHFSETALPGYAGVDFESLQGYDWDALIDATREIMALARKLKLYVVLGSMHRLTGKHKPHNSLYIINDQGRLINRYDKMFCTGGPENTGGDLDHYSPGNHLCVFDIDGVRCGAQICHDFRYPELYRQYYRRGVRLMFHSYHNAHIRPSVIRKTGNIWGEIVPPTAQAAAANNNMWISANNSSRRISAWPSFVVQPDGRIVGKLRNNNAGILFNTIDTNAKFYDASIYWRNRAIRGVLHSGKLVKDPRSSRRRSL